MLKSQRAKRNPLTKLRSVSICSPSKFIARSSISIPSFLEKKIKSNFAFYSSNRQIQAFLNQGRI